MARTVEAVVAGQICLDLLPELREAAPLAPGRMIEAGRSRLTTGGAVANTGLALHRLGVAARLIGRIGDDLFGAALRDLLEAHGAGLSDDLLATPGEDTSYTIILSPPGVDRTFVYTPGCNATFAAADARDERLAGARLFHFGYPPLLERMRRDDAAELAALFRRVKALGLTTALDMALPGHDDAARGVDWPRALAATLPSVDLFLPSVEELLVLLRHPAYERLAAGGAALVDAVEPLLLSELAERLLDMGAAVVGIKLGHRGMYLRSAGAARIGRMGAATPGAAWAGRELWAPCFAVDVAGTTGAGDATIAGLLMALLRGFGPEEALRAACAVGACSVEAADALSGVRPWPETEARLRAGWPLRPAALAHPAWHWDEARGIWRGPGERGPSGAVRGG